MKYPFSFGKINVINGNIAEIIVNANIELSIEMIEESERFFNENFSESFGILVNRVNSYQYTFEAKLSIGTNEKLKAIAVINYNDNGVRQSDSIVQLRAADNLNIKAFSGLELGWQQGVDWLTAELLA